MGPRLKYVTMTLCGILLIDNNYKTVHRRWCPQRRKEGDKNHSFYDIHSLCFVFNPTTPSEIGIIGIIDSTDPMTMLTIDE